MQKAKLPLILASLVVLLGTVLSACGGQAAVVEPTIEIQVTGTPTVDPSPTGVLTTETAMLPENTQEPPVQIDEIETDNETLVNSPVWYEMLPAEVSQSGYALVKLYPAVLYTSAEEAAIKGQKKRTLPGDEVFVSYSAQKSIDGSQYYEIEADGWMAGEHLQPLQPSTFRGIQIKDMPPQGFGWLIKDSFSFRSIQGELNHQKKGHYYKRYRLFEVFEVFSDTEGVRWYRVAEDEWLKDADFSYIASLIPQNRASAKGRWIEVNLTEQNLVIYENDKPIFATLVSTGRERGWTAAGSFTIYHTVDQYGLLSPDPNSIGNYYLEDVPHILFYQGSWALHGAYWHDAFGTPNSHGCVNLSLTDAHWLFDWAKAGDRVFLDW